MKIFIMTDMEGVSGVINHDDWVMKNSMYYEEGKKLLTLEVNAAVEGFFDAGADEIYVLDGHGAGGINQALLDERTYLIRGTPEGWPLGLDKSFDALAFVGQHAKAGTEYAHIAHTQWFNFLDYKINGISVGEFGQLALCASFLGIPTIFGSGDKAFTKEAAALINGIETVSIKQGSTPGSGDDYDCEGYRNRNLSAVHLHPNKARIMIKEGAKRALTRFINDSKSFSPPELKSPFRIEVSYRPNKSTPAYRTFSEDHDSLIRCMNKPEITL